MFKNGEIYLNQTQQGESRWWSWPMVFWIVILGWIAGQFIAIPMPFIAMMQDPELAEELMSLGSGSAEAQFFQMKLIGAIIIAGIFSIPFFLSFRRNGKASPFGYLTMLTVGIGFVSLFMLVSQGTSPEDMELMTKMIGAHPINYGLMLLTFPVIMFFALFASKKIHHRTKTSVITAASRIDWKRLFFALFLTLGVYGVFTAGMHVTGFSKVAYTFDPKVFFGFALVSLLLIPLQSATEEVVFRGYLNQAFGHYIKNRWVVFAITSAMFASMHLANPESAAGAEQGGFEHLLVMSSYFLFGFILCIIVYFEGGLEAAIGLHAGNNLFAAIFVNYEGSVLPTPSMFLAKAPEGSDSWTLILLLGFIAFLLYKTRAKTLDTA